MSSDTYIYVNTSFIHHTGCTSLSRNVLVVFRPGIHAPSSKQENLDQLSRLWVRNSIR